MAMTSRRSAGGERTRTADFEVGLKKHLIAKNQDTLGPRPELGDTQELIHFNRIVKWFSDGVERIELEPDLGTSRSWRSRQD